MNKKSYFLLVLLLTLTFTTVLSNAQAASLTYYYSEECPVCREFTPKWNALQDTYSNTINFRSKELNNTSLDELTKIEQQRGFPRAHIPAVLIEDNNNERYLLVGSQEVLLINDWLKNPNTPLDNAYKLKNETNPFQPMAIVLAALADAVNPCAIFIFTVAVTYSTVYKSKRDGILYGIIFCIAIFTTYFFIGVLGKSAIGIIAEFIPYIKTLLAISIIVLGVAHIWTMFKPKHNHVTELSSGLKQKVFDTVKNRTNLTGAALAGILCGLIELPCTGGPYAFALSILSTKPQFESIMWLLIYNLIYILPLLIILMVISFSKNGIEQIGEWRQTRSAYLHGFMGFILISAGIFFFKS